MTALLILVGLLLLVSIWAALVTYAFFWYENSLSARLAPDRGRRLKLKLISGLLSSILSVAIIIVTSPFGIFRRFWEPKEILETKPLLILVHGLYHNPSAWLIFRNRLHKAGFKNIFIMHYRSFFTSFEDTIKKFEKFVAEARQEVPDQPVFLIGHSLGGLLSRVYAERAQGCAIPAAVITLGSPHQGSKLAAFGLGKLASSLLYRGPLFAEIESGHATLPCTGIAFYSPVDNMVLPSEALRVPYQGWDYRETVPVSHTSMLYSKSIAQKVIEILNGNEIA